MTITVCAGGSFFFALAETAFFALGKWQMAPLSEEPTGAGKEVVLLLQEPDSLLATLVLGRHFTNAGVAGIALWLCLTDACPFWGGLLGALLWIFLFGELIPKTMASRAPERWAMRLAGWVKWSHRIARPFRQISLQGTASLLRLLVPRAWKPQPGLTDEEYQELLEMAYQQGTLARAERDLILQIIRLDRRTAKDVMKPRARMASISDEIPVEEMILAAKHHKHRRLPIYDETPDTIVGILNTRALLLDPQVDLAEAIEFPSFVPESMNLLQLFRSFQRQRRGLAMVLDEFGGTAGLVTTEDILEEVVGEIRGEAETEGFTMQKLGEGRWRTSGTMPVEEFRREYPELGEVHGVDTLGGVLVAQLGVVPTQGETVLFRGLRLTAAAVDERRVREVLIDVVKKKGAG